MTKLSRRVGFKFTNHTLRRTFGRMLWLAGVPIETIRDLLGHEDTKTTLLYIGVNMDDKSSAMDQLADYENAVRTADSGVARKRSGHWGIIAQNIDWTEYQNFLKWKSLQEQSSFESWQRL